MSQTVNQNLQIIKNKKIIKRIKVIKFCLFSPNKKLILNFKIEKLRN